MQILQPQLTAVMCAKRPYSALNGSTSNEDNFLGYVFSDIEANLLTSETRCLSFMEQYKKLQTDQKVRFLQDLAREYGLNTETVVSSAASIVNSKEKGEAHVLSMSDRMRLALRPKHKVLFTHIGRVPGGVKFLVDLRADVLTLKQKVTDELNSALFQDLNSTLRELLMMWFTVGFLNLERITWNSPCDLVQKVSLYEAVHRIRTWEDIKRRVGSYRRCYIFTHDSMPREPVVVLHTALTSEISSSIHSIIHSPRFRGSQPEGSQGSAAFFSLDPNLPPSPATTPPTPQTAASPPSQLMPPNLPPTAPSSPTSLSPFSIQSTSSIEEEKEDPSKIQCAVFYSITSTQKGLSGVDMGNYLIKAVVKKLVKEFPRLHQFSSLSPIPGFRDWLLNTVNHSLKLRDNGDPGIPVLLPSELSLLAPFQQAEHFTPLDTFKEQLTSHQWYRNQSLTEVMKKLLMRLCAHYLYVQKRRNYALNPVANFHLSNGAVLWRINFLADTSFRGLNQSCSLMVNYRYFLDNTDQNSKQYLEKHQIQASKAVLDLLEAKVS